MRMDCDATKMPLKAGDIVDIVTRSRTRYAGALVMRHLESHPALMSYTGRDEELWAVNVPGHTAPQRYFASRMTVVTPLERLADDTGTTVTIATGAGENVGWIPRLSGWEFR